MTVGLDRAVWVVQRNGGSVAISKLSSCERGLRMPRGFPKNLVAVADPVCPIAGLDRREAGPIPSATAAVDKTDPNHVYVAFASSTAPPTTTSSSSTPATASRPGRPASARSP